MGKGTRTRTVVALLAWALANGVSEAGDLPGIVLHLTNHAGIDAPHLALARAQADAVFSDIGVRLLWQGTPPETPDEYTGSELHLSVMLLSTERDAGKGTAGSDNQVLGIADRTGGTAFIYPVRIGVLAERTRRRTGDLLGLVIAHEVGHLLLPPGHSQGGIMARSMETDPTKAWALFSSGQARTVREVLARKRPTS